MQNYTAIFRGGFGLFVCCSVSWFLLPETLRFGLVFNIKVKSFRWWSGSNRNSNSNGSSSSSNNNSRRVGGEL